MWQKPWKLIRHPRDNAVPNRINSVYEGRTHQCGLGRYAEQVGESIYAKFKPTWSRYNRSEGHTEHGNKLLSAVKQFGGRRIN